MPKAIKGACPGIRRGNASRFPDRLLGVPEMVRKSIIILVCVIASGFPLKAKQDFERSYTLIPGRNIAINNRMGDIRVTGYKGEDIKIVAKIEGPDRDTIQIIDKSFGPRIDLFPISSKFKIDKTRVDFEVKVPESGKPVSLELKSGGGKIEVTDLSGNIVVNSFRGDVKIVNVQGNVYAHSVSGHMDVQIKGSQSRRWMKIDSGSGNISVTAPSDLDAWIEMSSNGELKTDYPIDIHKDRYRGYFARGKLGSGTQRIEISSNFGSASLLKK